MKKKLLAALLTVSMVIGLAACGSSGSSAGTGSAPESSGNDSGASANEAAAEIDTSEHVVINYLTTGDPPEAGTEKEANLNEMLGELNKILTEKCNAEIQIYYIPWTDYLSNYNLTLARMDGSVDLIGTASDWLDAWPNAKNGAFLELSEDMLKTYAPKTWESVPADHWDLCKYNGEIYLMPEDNFAQWTNHGWIYRLDWAKEAGLENGVHSWEDMSKYVLWGKENKKDLK